MSMTGVQAWCRGRGGTFWFFGIVGALGALGALGSVLFAWEIGSIPLPRNYVWWFHAAHLSYGAAHVWFYVSVALLLAAWAGIGIQAFAGELDAKRAWIILLLWGIPLYIGVPIFGRDIYSYIGQGELVRQGLNPYVAAPDALGNGLVYSSIATVWQHTTSPYGPLFVVLTHLCAAIGGHSLIAQVYVFRALECVGVVALMVTVPLVARHLDADPGVALWLGVLSPLALFSAISSGHNDTLMIALTVVGVLFALRGARRWAFAVFAVAATIKLPAAAGVVVVAVAAWSSCSRQDRKRLVAEAIVIPAFVIIVITELSGYGWSWLGPNALHIPTELRVLTTPTVSAGVFFAAVLHAFGISVAQHAVVTFMQYLGEGAAVIFIIWLFSRSRPENMTRILGAVLLVVVLGSPTVWPWYFLWGVTLLGQTSVQRSLALPIVAGGAMLLVGPGGTPMIGGNGFYVAGPLVIIGVAWFFWNGRWSRSTEGIDRAQ